jgi:hypothetical protein
MVCKDNSLFTKKDVLGQMKSLFASKLYDGFIFFFSGMGDEGGDLVIQNQENK